MAARKHEVKHAFEHSVALMTLENFVTSRRARSSRERKAEIMLVNMPWGRTHSPSMGLGILKSVLAERDVDCDVAYLNLAWYKLVEERLSSRASLTSPIELFEIGTTSELYGEWIFLKVILNIPIPNSCSKRVS